jgi:phosphatidylinositol glycan class A protein
MDERLQINVALVSDFYYPAVGGVELQIGELARYLASRVNQVVVITHCVGESACFGRQVVGNVSTYYLPWHYSSANVIYPTFILEYPEARSILRDEKIDLVHTHQSSSVLGICYGIFGYHLGLRVVHTEHSLYGFRTLAEMCFCWTITPVFELYDRLICVSRATRNNLIIRCRTNSSKTIVIPNAVMAPTVGQLGPQIKDNKQIRIVVVSRMVYRRGIDVLIPLLPILC